MKYLKVKSLLIVILSSMNAQKNEKPVCMVNAYDLQTLSKSALYAYVKMLTNKPEFVIQEMITLTGNSASVNYGIVQEWTVANLVEHTRPAPGRMAGYALKQRFLKNQEASLSNYCLTNLTNQNNDCHSETLPNACDETVKRLANTYGLQPEFLEAKCVEKEQRTGRKRDYGHLETVLKYAKQYTQRSFEGFFYTLYVVEPYFVPSSATLPQFATPQQPIAQESGYTPRTTSQVASKQAYAPTVAAGHSTPPRATQSASAAWKAYIERRVDYTYFKTWILPCSATKTGETVTIFTPEDVFIEHLQARYMWLLSEAFGVNEDAIHFEVKTPDITPLPVMTRKTPPVVVERTQTVMPPQLGALLGQALAGKTIHHVGAYAR